MPNLSTLFEKPTYFLPRFVFHNMLKVRPIALSEINAGILHPLVHTNLLNGGS
jgi:hypothetical protein